MSTHVETAGEKNTMSWGNRIKLGIGVALGIGFIGFGAEQGFESSQDLQAGRDQQEREDAAKDQACVRFEKTSSIVRTTEAGRVIVRLAELSPRQKDICGVPGILGAFDKYDNSKGYGIPLPKDAAIVKSSVAARLPSVGTLEDSAQEHLNDASSGVTILDVGESSGLALMGGLVGAVAFGLGATGLAVGAGAVSRRRQ